MSIFKNHETTWHPPVLWVGIGCERNTSKELITNSLNNFLESGNLSQQSIAGFATIDTVSYTHLTLPTNREV